MKWDQTEAKADEEEEKKKRQGEAGMCLRLILGSALLALALGEDLRSGKIPNRLLLMGGFLGLVSYAWQVADPWYIGIERGGRRGIGMFDPVWSDMGGEYLLSVARDMLLPILAAGLFLAIFFLLGALGAGDVKLLALLAGLLPADLYRPMLGIALGQGALLGLMSLLRRMRTSGRGIETLGYFLWSGHPLAEGRDLQTRVHFTICICNGFLVCLGWRLAADLARLINV